MWDITDTDTREAAKLDAYVPAAAGDTRPWWERVVEVGLTRAIDNQFGPPAANKTSTPGTFAGEDGRTYVVPSTGSGAAQPVGGSNQLLMWAAIGLAVLGVGYVALSGGKKG